MTTKTRRLVLASFVFVGSCKPSEPALTTADVTGLYVCNMLGPVQTVELRKDGTFVQTIGGDPESRTYHGHWGVENSKIGSKVMLLPYRFEWPLHLGPPSTGAWMAAAKHARDGRLFLVVSKDDGLYCTRGDQRPG
jgi:hypothetical protein